MLEKIGTPGLEAVSVASPHALEALKRVKSAATQPIVVAEVGVGIGTTTLEFVKMLGASDELQIFDRDPVVAELKADLEALPESEGIRIITHGNSGELFASYSWELATMVRDARAAKRPVPQYDFIYLDGAHAFHHDAAACVLLKKMLKPGGYMVIDDITWTFAGSPSQRAQFPLLEKQYTHEQLTKPHMALVVDVFLRSDKGFEEISLFGEKRPVRAVFRRKTKADRASEASAASRRRMRSRLGKVKRSVLGRG